MSIPLFFLRLCPSVPSPRCFSALSRALLLSLPLLGGGRRFGALARVGEGKPLPTLTSDCGSPRIPPRPPNPQNHLSTQT